MAFLLNHLHCFPYSINETDHAFHIFHSYKFEDYLLHLGLRHQVQPSMGNWPFCLVPRMNFKEANLHLHLFDLLN